MHLCFKLICDNLVLNLKIANKYANSKQCDKANEIYKTLETKVNILSYYSNYLKCLTAEEKYITAIALVQKSKKNTPIKLST